MLLQAVKVPVADFVQRSARVHVPHVADVPHVMAVLRVMVVQTHVLKDVTDVQATVWMVVPHVQAVQDAQVVHHAVAIARDVVHNVRAEHVLEIAHILTGGLRLMAVAEYVRHHVQQSV